MVPMCKVNHMSLYQKAVSAFWTVNFSLEEKLGGKISHKEKVENAFYLETSQTSAVSLLLWGKFQLFWSDFLQEIQWYWLQPVLISSNFRYCEALSSNGEAFFSKNYKLNLENQKCSSFILRSLQTISGCYLESLLLQVNISSPLYTAKKSADGFINFFANCLDFQSKSRRFFKFRFPQMRLFRSYWSWWLSPKIFRAKLKSVLREGFA